MGLFERFFGRTEGVYPDESFPQANLAETAEVSVENVEGDEVVAAVDQMAVEDESSLAEDKRIKKPEDAYAEAHYINATGGDYFKQTGDAIKFAEMMGDQETADMYRKHQDIAHESVGYEIESLNKIIVDAAKKNVGLKTFYGRGSNSQENDYLWHYLKNSETAPLYEFDPNSKGDFNYQKLEYLAGKIGTELEYLVEPKADGSVNTYPVVKLAETSKDITFVTNGTGLEEDYHARVFKMDKANMEQLGYTLKTGDHNSIFPKAETDQS